MTGDDGNRPAAVPTAMTELPDLTPEELDLYGKIYGCEACSGCTDPEGVYPFASRNVPNGQTVAVSNFGNVSAPVWLFVTNPKGSMNDPNVGLKV
jgi:hypothetical protein